MDSKCNQQQPVARRDVAIVFSKLVRSISYNFNFLQLSSWLLQLYTGWLSLSIGLRNIPMAWIDSTNQLMKLVCNCITSVNEFKLVIKLPAVDPSQVSLTSFANNDTHQLFVVNNSQSWDKSGGLGSAVYTEDW